MTDSTLEERLRALVQRAPRGQQDSLLAFARAAYAMALEDAARTVETVRDVEASGSEMYYRGADDCANVLRALLEGVRQ